MEILHIIKTTSHKTGVLTHKILIQTIVCYETTSVTLFIPVFVIFDFLQMFPTKNIFWITDNNGLLAHTIEVKSRI
jgi:hypothetical protein